MADKVTSLYNALMADGLFKQARSLNDFKSKMAYQGYRSQIYKLARDKGADVGTFSQFTKALGYQNGSPKPTQQGNDGSTSSYQQPQQQGKPRTAAQMAMSQGRKQEDVDYLKPPKPLQSKPQWKQNLSGAPENASPFVNTLYVADDEKRMADAEMIKEKGYTSRGGAKKMIDTNMDLDKVHAEDAADMIVNDERRRRNQPIIKTDTPADEYIGKTQGQLEDEASQTAKKMIDSDMGGYLDKVIGDEFKNAHARGMEALNAAGGGFTHGAGGADWFVGERAYQQQMDSQKQLEQITGNIKNNIEATFSDPKIKQKVLDDAAHLGVDPEQYVKNFLAPSLIDKAGEQFNKTQLNRMMAKGASDYIASGILDSLTGALLTGLTTSKNQRQMQQEANAMTEEGINPNYKPGTWEQAGRGAVSFTADAPAYAISGVGANALTGKVFGSAAQQAITAANQSVAKRVLSGVAKGVVHGGATGFQYGFVNGAVQNFSTGEDTSLGSTLKAGLKSAVTEGASFATMEGMGGAVGGLGYKIGAKGTERKIRSWVNHAGQKLGYEAIKTGMEGIGMATGGVAASYANHILTGEDWKGFSTEGTLESCASAVVFKLTHAKDIFKGEVGKDGKPLNFKKSVAQKVGRFFLSDGAKNSHNVFSDEEKHQLYSAGANVGMKPMEDIISFAKQAKDKKVEYGYDDPYQDSDIPMIKNAYDQIMADPNVSWDAKAKFTTLVMGTMPESRPMMDYVGVGTEEGTDSDGIHTYKTINEYAKDGTLLSKQRYDTRDQRDSIIYNLKVRGENSRLGNALALLVGQDRNNYDLQNAFFKKKATDWEQVQEIVDGMNTEGSAVNKEFSNFVLNAENGRTMPIFDAVAKENGMERKDLINALNKDPLKRTDAEQNACIKLRKAVEEVVFPSNKVHEEQSQLSGKDVAEENGLGTEQPNGEAVRAELNNLTQAENELEQFMKDNDVFGQNFENLQKQGLTNPQIYDWMVQNGGLTEEQLVPFAKYINANARVQGMQNGTQQMIEQKVSAYVQDWSMHGTLNGEKQNGEQAVWVQDGSGRTLVLGSGDVAFDSTTGRAKEGVGDMIICLDPNKGEMVYLKAEDVTLFQTQKVEDFGNEYRQKLQQINSQPYEQAAQEQVVQDANKESETEREDEQSSIHSPNGSAAALSALPSDSPSDGKGTKVISDEQEFANETNSPERISEEKDEWGKPLVKASDGSTEFGEISDGYGLKAAPIRLSLGENKKNPETGKDEGYGLLHIIARHGDQIRKAGYKSVQEFVEAVSKGYTEIREGVQVGTTQTYLIVKKDGHANTLYIELSRDGKYWNVNSAGIFKEKYVDRKKEIKPEPTVGSSTSTDTTGVNHGQTEGATVTSGNSPMISTGKDTNNSPNNNENNTTLTFADGNPVPMTRDSKGRPAPDFDKMTTEQSAEVITNQFGDNADKFVDAQIKKAEKALKDAEKMKVDYSDFNGATEQQAIKDATIAAAKEQLDKAEAVRKALTAQRVAETMKPKEETPVVEGANEAGSVAAEKFQKATRVQGNTATKRLPDGTKVKGHYEIVPAESLTPSHDINNGYKKSEGFPVDAEGRTINDRDYENDKSAQQTTDQMAQKYNGQAITQVPTVSDEGIVYDGNGRTMAGQKAAKEGTDAEYIEDLMDNAQNYGFTREQIEQSGIEHPRLVMVTDERLPYDTATFAKFNRNEKKSQSNTEQAVAKAKTLTADEVGAIVADIEGNGSLEAFFNNSKAINDLVKTLLSKGVIGQNEVAGFMEGEERLSAQGKEYVKNLLLGSVFKPETIRMLGIDSKIKNAAINGIRAIMDNLKLGDYSLRGEIDQAIQLLYEARRSKMSVADLLKQSSAFDENARDRFSQIAQAMAQALEGNASTFRELMNEYNEIAKHYNTDEGTLGFYEKLTPEQLVEEFINASKAIKNNEIKLYGNETRNREQEGGNHAASNEEPAKEAGGAVGTEGNGEAEAESQQRVDEVVKQIAAEITKQTGIEVVTDEQTGQSALEDAEATDSNVKYHKETDEEVLNQLNSGETIKVYRAMQVIDGKLYPPMAASVGGKLVEANEIGQWIRADENPNLAIPDIDSKTGQQKVDKKTGELKWKFKLDKGGKDATGKKATDVNAAYNPYWHMSRSPLNDQFKSAWIRPNIVVVECEVPVSELTSGYKAERAKDAVGEVDWKSGSVSSEVFKQTGRARKVILSRWCKPVRVLDNAEVAEKAKEFVGEAKVEIPENVLTPKQRIAFEEAGFKIGAPEKGVKKSEQILEAIEKGLQIDNSVKEAKDDAIKRIDERIAELHRQEERLSHNTDHGNPAEPLADGEHSPEESGAQGATSGAKVQRKAQTASDIAKKIADFIYNFDSDTEINADNFAKSFVKAIQKPTEQLSDYVRYTTEDGERIVIRLSDHSGNARNIIVMGRKSDKGYSIVIRTPETEAPEGKFKANKWADVEEYVYNNPDKQRLGNIAKGLFNLVDKGEYVDLAGADDYHASPKDRKEFRSKNGEVYGFVHDGKIYLDTKKMKPETPLHEYTHLWTEALKNGNPKEWENVKKLFDEVEGLKEEVEQLYPELKGDDLYEEMITTYSGREGAKKLEETVRNLAAKEDKSVEESAKAKGFIDKVKNALKTYWKGVADMLGIHFTSAEEVADKVLADWASGVNPKEVKAKEEPSKDPMQGIKNAAESYHEEKLDAARKAFEEAKASGDESEIKRTRDELKHQLDEKYKSQGMGLVQRHKEIAKEIGKAEAEKIEKPWAEMDGEERLATAEKSPLTEDEIRNNTSEENQDLIEDAIDYLNGDHGFAKQIAYLKIYEDVRNRHENAPDDSGAENGTQLAAADTTGGEGLGLGTGRESGGVDGQLDRGTGDEPSSREPERRESNQADPALSTGEPSDKQGEGTAPDMGAVPTRSADTEGSGTAGKDGNKPKQGGRGSGNRPAKPNAKRKPTAKQGTTWRGRTESEIKQEAKEAKAGLKAALAEMMKRGRGEASLSLAGLNSRQIEYVPELMKAVKRYGMSLIDQGIYKIKDWMSNIREGIHDDMRAMGFSDQDIDDFIDEMWNSKMMMDGETHTIAEWSSIYGNQKLREKLKAPLNEKYQKQMEAEPIEVKVGDRKNIEETLPFLLPQQQDDVLKAETQFFGKKHADRDHAYGKGYMFTNGTGTGKTYTGLGIAKRLAKQGKGRILFVTPSQPKVKDWIKDGKNLGLNIRSLDNWAEERGTTATTESGDGMVITTYANMRANKKILETEWDAIIYDESHRIMENKKGAETTGSMQHYMLSNRDENHTFMRLQTINPHYQKMLAARDRFDELRVKEMNRIRTEYKKAHPSATTKDVINATYNKMPQDLTRFSPADGTTFPKLGKAYQDFIKARDTYNKVEPQLKEQAKNTWKNTKTIFLSATPFNTRENLDYAEGYIFKFPEDDGSRMSGRSRFYLDRFGAAYRYRYNRLEAKTDNPEAIAKQEIAFSDYLQHQLGTMSGRIIDSPYDYSRDFPTVAPDHAEDFNNAVEEAVRGRWLGSAYSKTIGNYVYGSALFETMKVANTIDRIKQHLDAGRKVVVFHRRVETKEPIKPPFSYMLEVANEEIKNMKPGKERNEYIAEVNSFREKYADLLLWEKTLDYSMPREQLAKVFGKDNVLFFSGKENAKTKSKAVDTFNDDNSSKNIIVIQEASGKEGISLHDVTGNHQRVLITLGLPQSPITALQIEGRTYRIGNKSNAIFEYPILGLNSEMMLFGEKFNNQVSTTENLALGSQARNLRDSFAKGVLEHSGVVPIDQQGVGGKEFDAPTPQSEDPYGDAILDYYSNQKLNRNNREGQDYFPTPEPLGYKMVEWANMGEGDTALEPSAGHGAIARYVPKENQLLSIEPSQSLFTKLQLKAGGLGRKFLNNTFENYDIINKHDVVVMNPPFGTAGATAIAHLDKAFRHLDEGGRVVAIIPRGSTDKKFDKWYGEQKNVALRAEVDLPDIVFQQAGTNVRCRVVVLDKITDGELRGKAGYPEKIDLSGHYDKIEDFFEDLRDVQIPDRIVDTQLKTMKKARSFVKEINNIKGMKVVSLNRDGISVFDRNTYNDYSIKFPSIRHTEEWTKENFSKVYDAFDQQQRRSYNENSKAVLEEMKQLACKLSGMSEDEMQKYISDKKGDTHFRMEVGKTFSDSKENFDGVKERAVEEKGIVMPNLKKESVKIVPVEKHSFGENKTEAMKNARNWAKENVATKQGTDMPTMRDGTPYIISKAAIDKYLSNSAFSKSEDPFVHLSVLPKLTDVIHESIEAEIHPDYNKDEDGNRSVENGYGDNILVHRLYGAVELDGKTYRVKTTMQEFRGGEENKPHSYEVTKIELLDAPGTAVLPDSSPLDTTPSNSKNELLDSPGKRENPDRPPLVSPSNSISAAKLLNGVEKSYDSGKKLLDESKDLTDGEVYFRNDNDSSVKISKDAPLVVKHIAKVSEKLGTKVNMVNSAEEITNKRAKEEIEAGKNVQGWYDEKTGEVHLYMPNIHDRYTAEKTIWHETVGHKGMRELIGDERFDQFLDDIYRNLDKPEYADLKKLVDDDRKYNPFNYRDNIEEGIARLAEEGHGDVGFWRNLKNKVSDFLHEIGYRFSPNTKDVKYLLWLSKNMQKHPNDPFFKMRAEAVRYRLDHESMPEVKTEGGMFRDNDGKTRDLGDLPKAEYQEATDGKVHFRTTPSTATAIDRYHRALNAHSYMATESFMDNMLSLQALMKAVDPSIKKIEDVKSSENPYMLQNTMQGAMSNAAQMFERNVMQPLDKAMGQLLGAFEGKKDKDKIRNFNLYMITKHGLERNRVLFVRDNVRKLQKDEATVQDAKILQKQWDAEKKDLGDRLRNGKLDLKNYYKEMDEWIRNNVDKDFDASEHDYSGLHGVQGIEDLEVPYKDAEAIESVKDSEAAMEKLKAGSVKDFWSKVHAATSYSLYCDYANGFQSRETYTKTSQMFDWYVPLRKFDKETAEDVYGYVTEKGDPSGYIGSVVMGAKGRKSLSEVNVLAQIGAMGNMAISNGGKNAIKQAFMRFARSHDSQGLITEGEVWLKKDGTNADGSDRWVEVYPEIPDGAAPKTVSNIINRFEADMKAKQATGDAKVMKNAADIGYKFERAKDKSQHVVDVKVNGKTHRFYINGNPRAAQALNGMLENKGSKYVKPLSSLTRVMAQLCTSYSPEFVARNIVRDMQFASSNVAAKEGARYAAKWGEYYAKMISIGTGNISIKDLKGSTGLGLYAKYRNGTLDMNNKIHKYFKEFMENGGETGWVQVLSMKDWEKKYKRDIKKERSKLDKGGKAIKDFVFGNLENLNEVAENMARFATYCTSRDYGRSAVRSAYDAKEVSTNFNRHGSGDRIWTFKNGEMGAFKTARRNTYGFISSYLRQTSMFFNAGIQSTNLLAKNAKNAPKGTAVAMMGMPFAMGALIPLLNKWLISEEDEKDRNGVKDPYAELPDYIRRNNLCIYKGNGEFVTIPLAIELRAFYGLGDLAAGYTWSPNIKSQRNAVMDAVGCVSQLVPVMDYTNSHAVDKDPVNETIKALSPSALSPFVEWNLNSDWKGAPIRREKTSYNEYQPAWMRAYKNTPKMFMELNKKVNAKTNDVAPGNEEMLGIGFLDAWTDPAAWNHFLGGFGGGAATFATRVAKLYKADNPETNDIPFLRSFLYKPNEQSSMQRTKSKWYNYVDDMEKTMSNVQRLKSKNVPIDKRLENIGAYYKFKDSKEAQKAEIIEEAQKMMKKWKTNRDKSSDAAAIDNANQNIDLIMQEAVEKLDKLN